MQSQHVFSRKDRCHGYHRCLRTLVPYNLQKLSCAAELTIGTWFTEVLCMLQLEEVPIPELKCKYLTLELHIKKFNLYGAAGILQASPYVETLNIDIATVDTQRCPFELKYLTEGDNIDLQSWFSRLEFPNLKNVKLVNKIDNSVRACLKDHSEQCYVKLFKLSEFLLQNATVLEKFIIISKTRECGNCFTNCVHPYFLQLAEKLLGSPRSSTICSYLPGVSFL
ncbi:PREDICTED: uncharacterized protein LOC109212749 isoform X2 [Nicotiana attenuata]|uniref:uncharacterized protein LOC109212749 isoform X2 n=1 Tax=Nicotiana attenuata TaxID=49451 RepID=UPI0009050ED8|nr:PREDICTED: uncharacterized protein LOC109212749 isoform X2 [Nicotiana attenuata]